MLWNLDTLRSFSVRATDGPLGGVRDVLFEDQSWQVRYLVVDTGSWLFGRSVLLVPGVAGAPDAERKELPVRLTREQVKNSPPIEQDMPLERRLEEDLHAYYGWSPYWMGAGALAMPPLGPEILAADVTGPDPRRPAEERGDPHLHSGRAIEGYAVAATDGEVGSVDSFLIDLAAWRVRYLVVDTGTWLPGRKVAVSLGWLTDLSWTESRVSLALPREHIRAAPEYDPAVPFDEAVEQQAELWNRSAG
jgi:hypothetical protein